MSFFTLLGFATGDPLMGMAADKLLEPPKPLERKSVPAVSKVEPSSAVKKEVPREPVRAAATYRSAAGDRAYY